MTNFARVVRLALRYRLTFIASALCAIGVAILWGANIGSVYPFIEVGFQGDSLQTWVSKEIVNAEQTISDKMALVEKLNAQLAPGSLKDGRVIQSQISLAEARIRAEQNALRRYRWVQPYINEYLPNDPFKTLALLVGLLLIGTVIKDLFLIGNTILIARISELGAFDLRKLFYRRTLKMEMASFGDRGVSDLMSRFTYDMQTVSTGLTSLFGKLIREPLKMVACLVGAACICWRLLLLSLVVAPLAGFLISWLAKILKRANRRALEEMALLYNTLEETLRGIKIVKAFTMERHERKRFHLNNKEFYRKSMRIARYNSLSRPMTEVMGIITICLALLAGAYLVLSGETHLFGIRMSARPLSSASLIVFYGFLAGVADPLRKLSDVFTRLQRAAAACDRIFNMLDRKPKISDSENSRPLPVLGHSLVFDKVSFAYEADTPVLRNVNLEIGRGETIALVGPNGCGKSTLANLIPRFADPTSGEIRFDGIPLTEARLRDLRGQIGLVTQEIHLFNETVLDNIRYGCPGATIENIKTAAKRARAHDFIENDLSDGYQTSCGVDGKNLSGGQRQRIALARAILHDPTILILDEATSQVDLQSEQLIQAVLEQFVKDRTAIIVTHRLSVLALADRIVVMEAGQILAVGTHEDLLQNCDLYQRLHKIQFSPLRQSA